MLRFLSYIRKHQVAFVGGIDFAENRQDTYAPKFAIGKWMSSTLKCGSSDFVVWAGPNTSGLIHVLFRQDLGNVIEGNDYLPVQVAVKSMSHVSPATGCHGQGWASTRRALSVAKSLLVCRLADVPQNKSP